MEAGDVAASHDSRGDKSDKFYSDDPTITRAIATSDTADANAVVVYRSDSTCYMSTVT